MPVSYQSWDMASGPTVAYNMAGRTNGCVVADSPKGSNFSSFRIQDSTTRGLAETPKSSNYRISSSQDNVVWGLSALSLCGQSHLDTDCSAEENRSVSLGAFCCASAEAYSCADPKSTDSSLLVYAQSSGSWEPVNLDVPAANASFISSSEVRNRASTMRMQESDTGNYLHAGFEASSRRAATFNASNHATARSGFCRGDEISEHGSIGSSSETLRISSSPLCLTRTVAVKDDNLEPDTMSDSSFSSENGVLLTSYSSSGEASHDDTEAQSAYKNPAYESPSVGASSPPRKGLSKFYAGKARSFSCLIDVGTVKDLAKPEIPHAKKRRASSGSSGLPPLQKGASAIAKKPLHGGKSTLALAVAMKTEEYEAQASVGATQQQKSLLQSRSYSLPDLQGATQSVFFIG